MNLQITCPNCNHNFEATQGLKELYNQQAKEWQAKKENEFKQKENALQQQIATKELEYNKRLQSEETIFKQQLQAKELEITQRIQQEKNLLQQQLQEQLTKSITANFENQLKQIEQDNNEKAEKLKAAQAKELEYLTKERELKNKEAELEINVQKKVNEEREKVAEEIRKLEAQRIANLQEEFNLKLAEKEKQLEDQRKLAQQMKQKAEQGSMQLQGEIQELLLEELLKTAFPFDKIEEVGKGVRGADCVQTVYTRLGAEAGKMIYESKRTKDFKNEWIEKLKSDMRNLGIDIAIIVTQTMPKDLENFGEKDGVYICTFSEVKSVAALLRNAIIKVFDVKKSQHNQGDKMAMLYEYLVGSEFGEQWKAIREGFMSMKLSIQKERDLMEKIWKAREKQLEKVLLNATHIRGSIEGIAGLDSINLNMLDDENNMLLE